MLQRLCAFVCVVASEDRVCDAVVDLHFERVGNIWNEIYAYRKLYDAPDEHVSR